MKFTATLMIVSAWLWLGGCAAPPKSTGIAQSASIQSSGNTTDPATPLRFRQVATDVATLSTVPALTALPQTAVAMDPEPDAVIKLDPGSDRLSMEMESRLLKVAAEATQDQRIILRLESHVPDIGSPALNIGIAEKALQTVKGRLQALGVLPRRILLASFGGEHDLERDSRRHWVEIYLLRPGY